ncbi:hypothetical protein [Chromobacterium phragmitis]|uniref:Uncharacterized protein n=1 Tax=Chromobacterium phragmitis TaxID=2202141 RepID=A0A344UPH1_9NEIS|nr:hypothetical protein [Chromobacterium phragmitis]AXE37169.1 hypothetical protein DK843_22740 [Chromobacterium phragmitis]
MVWYDMTLYGTVPSCAMPLICIEVNMEFPGSEVLGVLISGAGASGVLIASLMALAALLGIVLMQIRKFNTADRGTQALLVSLTEERNRANQIADQAMRERNEAVQQLLAVDHQAKRSDTRILELEHEVLLLRENVKTLQQTLDGMARELNQATQLITAQKAVIDELRQMARGGRHD